MRIKGINALLRHLLPKTRKGSKVGLQPGVERKATFLDRETEVVGVWCVVGSWLGSVKPERCWNRFPINHWLGRQWQECWPGYTPDGFEIEIPSVTFTS